MIAAEPELDYFHSEERRHLTDLRYYLATPPPPALSSVRPLPPPGHEGQGFRA